MNKKMKIFAISYFIIMGIVLFTCSDVKELVSDLYYVQCGTATGIPKPVPQLTTIIYTLVIIGTPLILIAFSLIELFKAMLSGNADDVVKVKGKVIKKFLIAALVFSTAALVQFVINRVTSNDKDKSSVASCLKCFLYFNGTNCPASSTGNDVKTETTRPTYEDQADGSTAEEIDAKKSNSNSNSNSSSNSNSGSTGNFSATEIHNIAVQMVSWEAGIDSNGNPLYGNFGNCYALSSAEHGITIGAGGWMGQQAKKLLETIRIKYPDTFKKLDTAGIGSDLDHANWGTYCVDKNSAKGKAIIKIITSEDGKKVQDEMIESNVRDYIKEANDKGIEDKKAIVMYMDVRHVFGPGNLQAQLLDKAGKPYTFEKFCNIICNPNGYFIAGENAEGYKNRHESFKKFAENKIK